MHARHFIRAIALAPLAVLAIAGSTASAAVTIGQLPPATPPPACPAASTDYLQPSVTGGSLYTAREAGTITSWSTRAPAGGATYVLKVFRRTADPDIFQVVSQGPQQTVGAGLNTFAVNLQVSSGDMLGFNASGSPNACTFAVTGDTILARAGDLAINAAGAFGPVADSRLNLSAVMTPSNVLTLSGLSRNRHRGSASVTANLSNPGNITLGGRGVRTKDAFRTTSAATSIRFDIVAAGKRRQKLNRTGKTRLTAVFTFTPPGGDPAVVPLTVKLKKRR